MGLGNSKSENKPIRHGKGSNVGHNHYGNLPKNVAKGEGNHRYVYVNSHQPVSDWPTSVVRPPRQLQHAGKQHLQQLHHQHRQPEHRHQQQQHSKKVLVERNKPQSKRECNVCGHEGHASARCNHRNQTCNICGQVGHLASVCTQKTHHPNSIYKPRTAGGNRPQRFNQY
uniref:CCHC-type domain-containing protein n=1 Tax=Anopheles quadriannulatus TaxID=34691 RepID=A0A182XSR3_ANOQN